MLIRDAIMYGKKYLCESSTPFLDSIVLLEKATGMAKEKILISDNVLENALFDNFCVMLKRRKNNMPVQYIINQAEFMGLKFYVDENVLIPRPDTEILVETAIKYIGSSKLNVLDLCTGSGCIAVALKKFCPNIFITAVDISDKAIAIAEKNSVDNDVKINFLCADIFKKFIYNISSRFDIIISNPPYITSSKINSLGENVKCYEPALALDGGKDGLVFYEFIVSKINHRCKVFFEIGFDQAFKIAAILNKNRFTNINIIRDLSGIERVIYADRE